MNQWIALSFIVAMGMAAHATPAASVPNDPAQAAWTLFQSHYPNWPDAVR